MVYITNHEIFIALVWITWALLSAVRKRLLNLITHSLICLHGSCGWAHLEISPCYLCRHCKLQDTRPGGHFKNTLELVNLRAQHCIRIISLNIWLRYFVWNFKGYWYLWNSTQNILPIHWKMCNLLRSENLGAPRFTSSLAFLKRPPDGPWSEHCQPADWTSWQLRYSMSLWNFS